MNTKLFTSEKGLSALADEAGIVSKALYAYYRFGNLWSIP